MKKIAKSIVCLISIFTIILSQSNSVSAMTSNEGVQWAKNQIGKSIDRDNAFGAQCMDLIIAFMVDNFGIWPNGDAIDLLNYNQGGGFTVIHDSASFIPKPGDIAIFRTNGIYGHTSIITSLTYSNGKNTGFHSIDQNWHDSNLNYGSPAAEVWHPYYSSGVNFVGVLRPPYNGTSSNTELDIRWTSGTYNVTKNLYVRNAPDIGSDIIDTYYPGESINYDSFVYADDRKWLSYISGSGVRRYVEIYWFNSGNISISR